MILRPYYHNTHKNNDSNNDNNDSNNDNNDNNSNSNTHKHQLTSTRSHKSEIPSENATEKPLD